MMPPRNYRGGIVRCKKMYLIVGLGNPGKDYERTRHNVGFVAIDYLSSVYNIKMTKLKFKGVYGEGNIGGEKCILLKPQTYMNLSGESVREAADFYKIPAENVIIICDDISLPVAKIRIRRNGSDGGHNGLKSIISHIGGNNFPCVKIGVGETPHPDYDLADCVLGKFTKD